MAQEKTGKWRRIGWLMLAGELMLLLFLAQWLHSQYQLQERRLHQDIKILFTRTEERLTDSVLNQAIAVVLHSPDTGSHKVQVRINGGFDMDSMFIQDSFPGEEHEPGGRRITMRQTWQVDTQPSVRRISIRPFKSDQPMPEEIQKILRMALVQTVKAKDLYSEGFPSSVDSILLLREFGKELQKKQKGFVVAGWDTLASDSVRLFRYAYNNTSNVVVNGYRPYLLRSILPQVGFSLLLLLLIGLAFTLAYRVMKQQALFNRQKDSFISNISHELKTPVATTKVAIEALTTYNGIDNPERTRKYLHVASWEMDRLSTLIDRIMNIIQTESGNLLLDKKPVPLVALTEDIIAAQQPILREKEITIQWENKEETLTVPVDKMHIQGVIYNLLDNAVKYGGDLITIDIRKAGNNALLTIKDNGPGIRPEYQKKVFDSFFRVPSGNRHDVKGHGLGLSYARDIIDSHQGSISLESTPGAGAAFIISLPLNPSL